MTRSTTSAQGASICVGLDIGGTKTLAVAVDARALVLATVRLPTGRGPEGVITSSVAAVRSLAARLGVPMSGLATIGVGVPGVVRPGSGEVSHAVNLGLPAGILDLGSALAGQLAVPVAVENDVNAAALGAARLLGLDHTDLALLSIGTGLAAGIVTGGRLRRGSRGGAGEIGHVPVDPRGPVCGCGQRGCLESLASGSAIAAAWPGRDGLGAASSLFLAAANGDAQAVAVRDRFSAYVAAAVRLLVLAYDVETVVLGGGVTDVGPALLDAVVSALELQAASSTFLGSLDLPRRVVAVPAGSPVAAVGAALAGAELLAAQQLATAGTG